MHGLVLFIEPAARIPRIRIRDIARERSEQATPNTPRPWLAWRVFLVLYCLSMKCSIWLSE